MSILFIGDVHGQIYSYKHKIGLSQYKDIDLSIQVGDFGFKWEHDWFLENVDFTKHKVLFGNHDYIPYKDKPHSLGDVTIFEQYGLMSIRGAQTIDKQNRIEGRDLFFNEEMSYREFMSVLDQYRAFKPDIVVTHTAPTVASVRLLGGRSTPAITEQALQMMFEYHQPKHWIFGHFHMHQEFTIGVYRTLFHSLGILHSLLL